MTSKVTHVLLTNSKLRGVEYGILRDFEDEIIRVTGAQKIEVPQRKLPKPIDKRLAHGTRYSGLRKYVPKKRFEVHADVLWLVLMGPENFTLDLYENWDLHVGTKILYIFDTFESHLTSIRRVLKSAKWDFTFTAFQGAQRYLEKHTRRKWYLVHQGVKLDRFRPCPVEERVIDFCSYGRQLEKVHKSINEYCSLTGKYYDFNTTVSVLDPHVTPRESYRRYAWHLNHSIFNFCWPLDVTHPDRVLTFSPISPRYFEAAASGNVMIGQAPNDTNFEVFFGANAVIPIDYSADSERLNLTWESLWKDRHRYLQMAIERRARFSHGWTWESRVNEILNIIANN